MSFKIGIDGGGTKTECILIDAKGAVAGRHLAPGCNPSIAGPDQAQAILREALVALWSHGRKPKINATLLCMAGSPLLWKEFAAGLQGFGRALAANDSLPVLELAVGDGPGLVLHAGTGSFVAARKQALSSAEPSSSAPFGEVYYAGGLGWRFGDPGSGHDLGRRAVARALLELQGWMPPSGLSQRVKEFLGLSSEAEIKRHFYSEKTSHSQMAGFAPHVLRLAEEGDPAAHAVLADSVLELLDLAVRVAGKLFGGASSGNLRAGLSGPILTHPVAMKALTAAKSGLVFHRIDAPPIEGVRRLLGRIHNRI